MADVAYNALHMAAAVNDVAQMEALLEDEVDVDGRDEYNWTALHYAANTGHYDAAALLIEWEADLYAVRLCPLLCHVVLRCAVVLTIDGTHGRRRTTAKRRSTSPARTATRRSLSSSRRTWSRLPLLAVVVVVVVLRATHSWFIASARCVLALSLSLAFQPLSREFIKATAAAGAVISLVLPPIQSLVHAMLQCCAVATCVAAAPPPRRPRWQYVLHRLDGWPLERARTHRASVCVCLRSLRFQRRRRGGG